MLERDKGIIQNLKAIVVRKPNSNNSGDLITDLRSTMINWLDTMRKVINEKQTKDEEINEDCGLRNEMD